jgi:phage protein D
MGGPGGLPFLDGGAGGPAGVTRPAATVKFGAPASSASGFGGIVDAAASLLAGAPGDPWREHLLALRLRRVLAPEVDVLALSLAAVATAPPVALADEGTVSLTGPDGADVAVFTGRVDGIHERGAGLRVVTATNGARELAQARLNQSYEEQDAGDIIQQLATELGLTAEVRGTTAALPRYVVDDRVSLYGHVARLAALSGLVVCIGADGTLKAKDPAAGGEPAARVAYGADVIDFTLGERAVHTAAVQVTGEGAAGDQGSDAWAWLRKDPAANQSTAGSGTPLRTASVAALRSAETVATLARARARRAAEAATRGWLLIAGAPQVEPGDSIEVSGMPQSARNGTYRVEEIVHELDVRRGYRSRLRVVNTAAGGGAGGIADLLGGLP